MKFIIEENNKRPKMLDMSGRSAKGDIYEVNSKHLIKNGKPILPVMGEFHFSRWNPKEWEEALLKMKAGGIQIVATYVFWIHHEEKQNEWDFSGSRNLREFLEICKKTEMPVWLRIGPWAHGECRNGGFPDWLVNADFPTREDDEEYLSYVKNFWSKIAEQSQGMMCKDGGPVIGIQLENEYGHCCGGPGNREEGIKHLLTLKKMATELGMETPYYTVTAWGGAYVAEGETLPVYGGYVDAPWAQHVNELPASENFLFIPFHNDENIGSDLKASEEAGEDKKGFEAPYLTAELGGGLQVTAHRRTYPYAADIEAQSLCMLGAGANLLGYYMYHGGFNPDGRYTTLQESKATGYANDLPIKSYDFQTCIRESGELNESYRKVKKLHLMIEDFQEILAPSEVYLPNEIPISPEDMDTVRASVRHNQDTGEGFLFINNHQRNRNMKAHKNWCCSIIGKEAIQINNIDIERDECMVIPYNLNMGDTVLLQTNASLLCRLGEYYFFYTDKEPVYKFSGNGGKVITLTSWEADRAYKFGDKLVIADCALYEKNGEIYAISQKASDEIIYFGVDGERKTKTIRFKQIHAAPKFEYIEEVKESREVKYKKYRVAIDAKELEEIHELYVQTDYSGDKAEVYHNGKLIADWFTTGDIWHLALKRYGYPKELEIRIYPSVEEVYYDLPVEHGCSIKKVSVISEAIEKVVF